MRVCRMDQNVTTILCEKRRKIHETIPAECHRDRNVKLVVSVERGVERMINIDVAKYDLEHGHGPRGRDYWMFDLQIENGVEIFEYEGKYSEAIEKAIKKAEELGCCKIVVMP